MSGPGDRPAPVAVALSATPQLASFVLAALTEHRSRYRRNGVAPPAGLGELIGVFRVSVGQDGSTVAEAVAPAEVEPVKPLLYDQDEAAASLGVSRSSIKRLAASGALRTVKVLGRVS